MSSAWREYGVIVVLLVVAVGGYLFVSRADEDLVAKALEQVSAGLLALVPEGADKEKTREALAQFETRVENREVSPEQIERLAASVLNLHSTGTTLRAEDADLVVRLALDDETALPEPVLSEGALPRPASPPKPPKAKTRTADLTAAAERVESMFAFMSQVERAAPRDSTMRSQPSVRFYAQDGLKAVVDERLRTTMESVLSENTRNARMVAWQARLAESVNADRRRLEEVSEAFEHLSVALSDSLVATARQLDHLAQLRHLESRGVVTQRLVDSLATLLEGAISREFEGRVFAGAGGRDVVISASGTSVTAPRATAAASAETARGTSSNR